MIEYKKMQYIIQHVELLYYSNKNIQFNMEIIIHRISY
jgi:hypothetical protein